jgi:thioredoxin-related protein
MKRRPDLAIIALLITLIPFPAAVDATGNQAGDAGIQWFSYAEGMQRGQAENKKVFLVFDADWCRYCLKMEKETFAKPTVIAYVNRNFIPISVNSDKQPDIAEKYKVRGLPSMWFISEAGEPIANRPGYIAPDEMLKILKFFGTDSYRTMSYNAFLKKGK